MASAVQKIKFSPSRDIPFNKLVLSQANVRRVKAGVSIEQLTHWQEADRETFARAWSSEVAEVAPFTDSEIHIVAGLLHRSGSACRMNRRECIGSRPIPVNASIRRGLRARLIDASNLSPDAAFTALMDRKTVLDLAEGLQLRRVRVMGANRIELSGFTNAMRDRLSAYDLFHEIISWKLRMFVPIDTGGVGVLSKVLERYPVARIVERAERAA